MAAALFDTGGGDLASFVDDEQDIDLALQPLGDGFISLIKMIVGPIVFCVVVLGITGAGDLKAQQTTNSGGSQ